MNQSYWKIKSLDKNCLSKQYNINHWHTLHGVYIDNLRRDRIEQTATKPTDAIDSALENFWEQQDK